MSRPSGSASRRRRRTSSSTSDDNLYCGNRHGDIIRFFAPDHKRLRDLSRISAASRSAWRSTRRQPRCLRRRHGPLRVTPDRKVDKLTDETNRSCFSIIDDSRLRLADDLDIAPDGRIFFSEATVRYEMHEWPVDALEARGNGRIICYDPKQPARRAPSCATCIFPTASASRHDGQSILFAETWGCRDQPLLVRRTEAGPASRSVIETCRAIPDNINRASDGNYWLALARHAFARRFDLALRMPDFRRRMARAFAQRRMALSRTSTPAASIKFNEKGEILEALWDLGGNNHPMITSMREHRGYLYIGGISQQPDRPYKCPAPTQIWIGATLLGRMTNRTLHAEGSTAFARRARTSSRSRSMDGALKPNNVARRGARVRAARRARQPGDRRRWNCFIGLRQRRARRPRRRHVRRAVAFDRDVTALAVYADGALAVGLATAGSSPPAAAAHDRRSRAATGGH